MSDRHEWTDDLGAHSVHPGELAHDPWTASLQREILRLAARVRDLEGLLAGEAAIEAQRDMAAAEVERLAARVKEMEEAAARDDRLAALSTAGLAAMQAVIEPLLPLFRERVGAWERVMRGKNGDIPLPDTITLTAEFPVEALRALTKE